jgi:hypothetical protein
MSTLDTEYSQTDDPTDSAALPEDPIRTVALLIAKHYADGDLISMDWLRQHLDIKEPNFHELKRMPEESWAEIANRIIQKCQFEWLEKMDRLRVELLEVHKIALKNIRGQGYLRLPPKEQTEDALKQLEREMSRQFRKTHSILVNVRIDCLTDEERRINVQARNNLDALRKYGQRRKRLGLPKP